jgi:hypothetical protein
LESPFLEEFALYHRRPEGKLYCDTIGRSAQSTWTRNLEREAELRRHAFGEMFCISRNAASGLLRCTLWIARRRDGSYYVSNILADEKPSLTKDEYNEILRHFRDEVREAAEAHDVRLDLGQSDPQLEDYFSSGTADLLREFARAARDRSLLHPNDRHRWNLFLSAAYRERNRLPAELLTRWLIDDEYWPEDEAVELGAEYERARDLLAVFEQAG